LIRATQTSHRQFLGNLQMKLNLFASIALSLMTATLVGQPRAGDNPFIDEGWVPKGRSSGAKAPSPAIKAPVPATKTATTGDKADSPRVPAVVGLPPEIDPDKTYRIAPDDELAIKVFQVDELSTKERVSAKGTIMMPLIGVVKVGGLTPGEAGALIAQTLGRDYLQDPQVNIDVVKATSQKIVVMGSVKKPGVFPVSGQTTLLQAIALAEGPDRVANQEEIIVFRPDPAGKGRAYVVDLKAVLRGELQDPILVGNDRIVVPESGTAVFIKGLTDTLRGFVSVPFY
jgi:polysaccharide biosynthesis/export protein